MSDKDDPLSVEAFESFVSEYKAAQAKSDEHEEKNRTWSIRTFVAVAVYTGITASLFVISTCTLQTEKDNFYYGQRASVVLHDAQIVPIYINLNKVQTSQIIGYYFIPQWENTGNTAAVDLNSVVNFQFSRDDLAEGFTNVDSTPKIDGPASVGPKQILSTPAFRQKDGKVGFFPQACLDEADKYRFAYIWGWARYKDVFRDETRTTKFCWRIHGTMSIRGELTFVHALCDEGNCTDDSCEHIKTPLHPKLPESEVCQMQVQLPAGASPVSPPPVQAVPLPSFPSAK